MAKRGRREQVLDTEIALKIVFFVQTHPLIGKSDLVTLTGFSAPLISKYLKRLLKDNVVIKTGKKRGTVYSTPPEEPIGEVVIPND